MELIERYLNAVKFWLPARQSEDIIAELSADIYAQTEERAAELGRQLTTPEVEALLKLRGRPVFVASRFLPQEHLIGPLLFPVYRYVLTLIGWCYLIPWIALSLGLAILSPAYPDGQARPSWLTAIAQVTGHMWSAIFIAFGMVTLTFAILDRIQARSHFLEQWSPAKLPPARNPHQIPRSSSSIEMAVNWIFFFWWVVYLHSPEVQIGGSVHISLSPVWLWFYWGYFVLALGNATLAAANLMRPYWTAGRAALRLMTDAAGGVLFCWLMKANILAGIAVANVPAEKTRAIAQAINQWAPKAFPVAVLAVLIVAAVDVYRIVRVWREPHAVAAASN